MNKLLCGLAAVTLSTALPAAPALAADWTLDNASSRLAFGSVKANSLGEVHHFETLSGGVSADGAAMITIDLNSVQTNIDIRNERMIEHVFKATGTATLSSQIDIAALEALPVGGTAVTEVEATLSLVGTDVDLDLELFVARLSDSSVMVTTNDMIFLDTDEAGIDGGIDVLKQLADLSGITRAAPVTLRFVFTQN